MEELLELRHYIEQERYIDALSLVEEMDEISREDKINKIRSFAKILLLHLIKQAAENRTTRSSDIAIGNAVGEINYLNRCRKGTYLDEEGLQDLLNEAYPIALDRASLQAFGGLYDEKKLGKIVDEVAIIEKGLGLIQKVGN